MHVILNAHRALCLLGHETLGHDGALNLVVCGIRSGQGTVLSSDDGKYLGSPGHAGTPW